MRFSSAALHYMSLGSSTIFPSSVRFDRCWIHEHGLVRIDCLVAIGDCECVGILDSA